MDHATHAFGLAVPAGIIASTGVGGLTLGGGIGHLTRQCGLTIDNLLEVEMVLADGRVVTVNSVAITPICSGRCGAAAATSASSTSFLFKAHPIHTDYAGPMLWALERRGRDDALVSRASSPRRRRPSTAFSRS